MYLFRLPDELYIERLRKRNQKRKTQGIVLILLALIMFGGMHFYVLPEIQAGASLHDITCLNDAFLIPPADPQLLQRNLAIFSLGFMNGSAYFAILMFSSICFGNGLRLILTKDRQINMLLEFVDAQNQHPPCR